MPALYLPLAACRHISLAIFSAPVMKHPCAISLQGVIYIKPKHSANNGANCYAKFMERSRANDYAETMENINLSAFRHNLIRLRDKNGLSQEQLSELLGVSRTAVAKWEAGYGMPKLNNLVLLSRLFSVSLDELIFPKSENNKGEKP